MTHPPKLSPSIIERAKRLSSTLLSDAVAENISMSASIKPVSKTMKVVGTATTVSLRPTDNLFLHQAIYSGEEGYVLIADGKGELSNAYLGELMIRAAKAIGLEGIVIDGAIRDREALEDINFPIFSAGFVPNGPLKDGPGTQQSVITCGGVVITPGDLVVGDADGVTVVPQHLVEDALTKAERKLDYEKERIAAIEEYELKRKEGQTPPPIEPKWLAEKIKPYITN
ncbi:RraA family protein [Salicibibacter kimchii]|uniref:Putative 4-hydroxy-4-methyl-2-oxoglutarate aldolase n=1 Tax=Salicibibacter kimchii TaxID=2099786 RepID=A0A345BWG0_9BACI|nr:RraA family protein [Salicibibacter kimchii]AXF55291.1 RraA family protein [Salicibibacter kimchii]